MNFTRQFFAQWCEINVPRFELDKVEFSSMPENHILDKSGLSIEHRHLLASFTVWGEQGMTEWLVVDPRSGETLISRDEEFMSELQLIELTEKALREIAEPKGLDGNGA